MENCEYIILSYCPSDYIAPEIEEKGATPVADICQLGKFIFSHVFSSIIAVDRAWPYSSCFKEV